MKDYSKIVGIFLGLIGLIFMSISAYLFFCQSLIGIVLGIAGILIYTVGIVVITLLFQGEPDLGYNEFDEKGLYL